MNEKVMRHKELCDELNDLYAKKNHDYGDSFHQTFVEEGQAMARIRLGDKFSRFKTLTQSGSQLVTDESVRDTLLDLANYAVMTVLEMDEVSSKQHGSEEKRLPKLPAAKDLRRKSLTVDVIEKVKKMLEKGSTESEIVQTLGVTKYRIRKIKAGTVSNEYSGETTQSVQE